MKIAAFNVENLFDRAKAFNEEFDSVATEVLDAVGELNGLFEHQEYSPADQTRMLELVDELNFNRYDEGPLAFIRKIRGQIFYRPQSGGIQVVATGRDDWIGWVELKMAPVNEIAVLNTGRVIRDVNADVLAVIEAENRVALKQFTEFVFNAVKDEIDEEIGPYEQFMLIDGNDMRGIDVGLMAKNGYQIGLMRSHIHDLNDDGTTIYSRDCPEFAVTSPDGELFWILPNHFKSKFGGNDPASRNKRKAQATQTKKIYERLIAEGHENIIILGDFNDTPDSKELKPLLKKTDLTDVSDLIDIFDTGEFKGRPGTDERGIGTYGLGNDGDKIDYLLLSPALVPRVTAAGLFRKGAWPGVRPPRWTVYEQLKKKVHVASDHHVIWVEIN